LGGSALRRLCARSRRRAASAAAAIFESGARPCTAWNSPSSTDDYLGRVVFHYHTDTIAASVAQGRGVDRSSSSTTATAARRRLRASLTQARLIEGVIFFGLSLLAISLITVMTIIRPLTGLTRHAEDIAKGYWHFIQACDTSAQRQDELGILIRTFNLMLETIRATHQALKDANAHLEQKVRERTRELEEKNQAARAALIDRQADADQQPGQARRAVPRAAPARATLRHALLDPAVRRGFLQAHQRHLRPSVRRSGADRDGQVAEAAACVKPIMSAVGGARSSSSSCPRPRSRRPRHWPSDCAARSPQHDFPGGSTSVTISAGLSSYRTGDTQDAMVERADQALYRAKSESRDRGRNRSR
jgi:hypothetical protein